MEKDTHIPGQLPLHPPGNGGDAQTGLHQNGGLQIGLYPLDRVLSQSQSDEVVGEGCP